MKFYVPFVLFIVILLSACSENTVSEPLDDSAPKWNAFHVTQTYYDSLEVKSENRIFLQDQRVKYVVLLTEFEGRFIARDTVVASYVPTNEGYYLNFVLRGLASDRVIDASFRIHYEIADGIIAVIDTSEYMLDYAYQGVENYISALSLESGTTLRHSNLQDFDLSLNSIFFHPLGQAGIFNYRYSDLRSEELVGALSGNYIAVMQEHLFFEMVNTQLFRLALQDGAQPEEIDLSAVPYENILGLAAWQDKLFIYFDASSGNFLGIFDLNGNLLETIDFPRDCLYLAVSSTGILYTNEYTGLSEPDLLVRFDLNSETFLEDKIHPGNSPAGLRVWGERLYFTDYPKPALFSLPLSALEE